MCVCRRYIDHSTHEDPFVTVSREDPSVWNSYSKNDFSYLSWREYIMNIEWSALFTGEIVFIEPHLINSPRSWLPSTSEPRRTHCVVCNIRTDTPVPCRRCSHVSQSLPLSVAQNISSTPWKVDFWKVHPGFPEAGARWFDYYIPKCCFQFFESWRQTLDPANCYNFLLDMPQFPLLVMLNDCVQPSRPYSARGSAPSPNPELTIWSNVAWPNSPLSTKTRTVL
jgi:hypothetical protein